MGLISTVTEDSSEIFDYKAQCSGLAHEATRCIA